MQTARLIPQFEKTAVDWRSEVLWRPLQELQDQLWQGRWIGVDSSWPYPPLAAVLGPWSQNQLHDPLRVFPPPAAAPRQ